MRQGTGWALREKKDEDVTTLRCLQCEERYVTKKESALLHCSDRCFIEYYMEGGKYARDVKHYAKLFLMMYKL